MNSTKINLLQECQSSKKQLILFADGQHNTTWMSHNYANQIRQFLNEVNLELYLNTKIYLFFFIVFDII